MDTTITTPTTINKDKLIKELNLEKEYQEQSYIKTLKYLNEYRTTQNSNVTLKGTLREVVSNSVQALALQLKGYYDSANTGKPGKRHSLVSAFTKMNNYDDYYSIFSFITLRTVINNSLSKDCLLSNLSYKVGKAIEEECKYRLTIESMDEPTKIWFKKVATEKYDAHYLKTYWNNRKDYQEKYKNLSKWEDWDKKKCVQIGLKLLELLVYSTGLGTISKTKSLKNGVYITTYFFNISQGIIQYMEDNDELIAQLSFDCHPMIIKPKDWSTPTDGGYYLDLKKKIPFIKKLSKKELSVYEDVDMPNVYNAVNIIQSTKWKINKRVLEVANQVAQWNNIPESLNIPPKDPPEKPYRDPLCNDNEDMHKAWKEKMINWYRNEIVRKSKRLLVNAILSEGERYKEEEEIYFPHNIDFRGRIYPLTQFGPQGNDLSKSLLLFAEGKPLGEQGRTWLAFHGANCFGLDKKPLVERLSWVYDNSELILAIATNPLENKQWMEADSPWEFLAFCFEWEGVLNEGEKYVCSLPVAFDGSCSGLQHYSAMLRDEVGGSAVNLVPSDSVQDIYRLVSDKVNEYLKRDADLGEVDTIENDPDTGKAKVIKSKTSLAREWLNHGVSRSVCKRPTMTLCYGSSKYGFSDQIYDDTVYLAIQHKLTAFSDPRQASRYLAELIWTALGEIVVKAREAMDWLQTASSLLAKDKDANGKSVPTYWVTPAGFPIYQKYRKESAHRIKTVLYKSITIYTHEREEVLPEGTAITPVVNLPTDCLDPRKQRQGIAPNFVHSMDACHMMLTVLSCYDKGLRSFACIHDSFGTLPADAQTLFTTVREVFCKIYEENDVLQDFHDQVEQLLSKKLVDKLPPCPTKGNLDLEKVKESLYAFS